LCRNPDAASQLRELRNTEVMQCDVTVEENVRQVAEQLKHSHQKLDLVINSSGILHPSGRGETRLQDVSLDGLASTFAVNAFGPILIAKHLAPLLQKGSGLIGSDKYKDDKKKCHAGILVNMSARVGSISDNNLGGWYSYRTSKAALNMATKTLALELGRGKNRVICLALHPGTVDTDLSRPYHRGVKEGKLFTTQYSVSKLLEIVDNASTEDSGSYLAWDGQTIPF